MQGRWVAREKHRGVPTLFDFSHFSSISGITSTCPRYADPLNGRLICDHVLGKYCSPECHAGFQPSTPPAWAYICNVNTKKWTTYPANHSLPWPDCVPVVSRSVYTFFLPENLLNISLGSAFFLLQVLPQRSERPTFFPGLINYHSGLRVGDSGSFLEISRYNFCPDRNMRLPKIRF